MDIEVPGANLRRTPRVSRRTMFALMSLTNSGESISNPRAAYLPAFSSAAGANISSAV